MPIVKVHMSSSVAPHPRPILVKALREKLVEVLQIDPYFGQIILYDSVPQYRCAHKDRDNNFIFVEITLYPGRSAEMKKTLMKELVEILENYTKVNQSDINCCILEVAPENWYGGVRHGEAQTIESHLEQVERQLKGMDK